MRHAFVSVFEILEVRGGLGLRLHDLLTDEEIFLHDDVAARRCRTGTFLLSWLAPLRGRVAPMSASYILPDEVVPTLLGAIENAVRERGGDPDRPPRELIRRVIPDAYGVLLDHLWDLEETAENEPAKPLYRADYLVEDPERVRARLQEHPECRRTGAGFIWLEGTSPARSGLEPVILRLRTVRLSIDAPSGECLERGKRFVSRVLGSLVRHRMDHDASGSILAARLPVVGTARAPVTGEREPIFDSEGAVYSFSREMDGRIRDQLEESESPPVKKRAPRTLRSGDRHHLPRLAHEVMYDVQPGMRRAVNGALQAHRDRSASGASASVIHPEGLIDILAVQDLLRAYGLECIRGGLSEDLALVGANLLGSHAFYALNHELFHKKTFWVDEALAWMLSQTSLDIQGECLQLPFPSSAFVYTDGGTLELCESLLSQDRKCRLRGIQLSCLTVYVIELPEMTEDGARTIEVCFLFDDGSREWPYMLVRSLFVHSDDHLDAILDSLVPGVDPGARDPLFSAPELVKLLHLVVNSILYCTSAHLDPIVLQPGKPPREKRAGRSRRRRSRRKEPRLSRDHVLFLPGKIDISHVRQCETLQRTPSGRTLMKRFMVRGHWRRANPNWEDQRLRWIEPYWKGPEIGQVIEREYRLRP